MKSMPIVRRIAVDAGGTSTRAVVVTDTGECLGYGLGGSGNPTASGADGASASIVTAVLGAIAAAGLVPDDISSASVSMAGASGAHDGWLRDAFVAAGLPAEVDIEADLVATYLSGSLHPEGYAVVAGTGAIAARIRDSRLDVVSDGLGWLIGDAGSGFWIGHQVVRAAAAAIDGRAEQTALVGLLLAEIAREEGERLAPDAALDIRDENGRAAALGAILASVYRRRPADLARFSRLAFDASSAGDAVADEILTAAAEALAGTLASVVIPEVRGPLVLGGGILARQPVLAARVTRVLHDAGIDEPVTTVPDGTVGAAVLTLRRAGVAVDDVIRDRIVETLSGLR